MSGKKRPKRSLYSVLFLACFVTRRLDWEAFLPFREKLADFSVFRNFLTAFSLLSLLGFFFRQQTFTPTHNTTRNEGLTVFVCLQQQRAPLIVCWSFSFSPASCLSVGWVSQSLPIFVHAHGNNEITQTLRTAPNRCIFARLPSCSSLFRLLALTPSLTPTPRNR